MPPLCDAGSWDRQQPAARNRLLSRNEWLRHHSTYIWSSIYGFGAATMWSPLLLAPRDTSSSSFLARRQDSSSLLRYPALRYHQKHVSLLVKLLIHILSRDYLSSPEFSIARLDYSDEEDEERTRKEAEQAGEEEAERCFRARNRIHAPTAAMFPEISSPVTGSISASRTGDRCHAR